MCKADEDIYHSEEEDEDNSGSRFIELHNSKTAFPLRRGRGQS